MYPDRFRLNNKQKIFYLVMALIFTDTVLYGTIVPLIPIYMKKFNLTTSSIGAIFSAYAFGVLVFSIPLGMMAEKYGYRKIFLSGMTALTISCLFYGLVNNAWILLLCRFVQGAAASASWTAGLAIVAVLYPLQQGQKIGLLMAVMGLGTIFGPPIGGFLYHFFGYQQMFVFLGLFCLVLIALIFQGEFAGLTGSPLNHSPLNFFIVMKDARVLWLTIIVIVLASIFGMLEILMPDHMDRHFGLDTVQIGLCFGIMGIVHAVSDALSGHLSDHWGYETFIFWGLFANALSIPWLAWAPSIFWLLALLTLVGIATGAAVTPSQPLMYQIVMSNPGAAASGGAGYIYGYYNTVYSIGMFLGPVLGGFLNKHLNLLGSLEAFALLFMGSALLFYGKIIRPVKVKKCAN